MPDNYPIEIHGKMFHMSLEHISYLLKEKLKKSLVVNKIFKKFGVSINQLDDLQVEIVPLTDLYAETDVKTMRLDPSIIRNILGTNFFIILHEICHFVSRKAEERATFVDPEEVLGMVMGCAGMMEEGYDDDTIYNVAWPKIEFHFHNQDDAQKMMKRIFEKARTLLY